MARVGDWTRPTERMFLPPRRAARLMNRVRDAPQIRSITCRASPAAASAKSSSAVEPNAVLDLLGRDRREPGPGHGDVGPGRADQVVGLLPDQLPLGVEVGRDRDPVGPLRELLDQVHDLLVGRDGDGARVDQGAGRVLLRAPVRVPGLEVDLDHVAAQAHHGRVAERVGVDAALLPGLDIGLLREDPGDPLGRDVLLGDDQVHVVASVRASASSRPSSRGSARPRVFFMTWPAR